MIIVGSVVLLPGPSTRGHNKQATYKSRQSTVLTGHGLQVSKSPVAGVQ